jgi:hypothetical protein
MRQDQIALAAELLNMDKEAAAANAYDIRNEILCTYSNIRGLGSVLVGPDLSVLFYASFISPDEALEAWDRGVRTPKESFAALHINPDASPPNR